MHYVDLQAHQKNWWDVYNRNRPDRPDEEDETFRLDRLDKNNARVKNRKYAAITEIWLKRMFYLVALGLNLGVLAGIGLVIYMYCPTFIPNEALLVSPFVGGVLAALISLKLTTWGVTPTNYQSYSNPLSLMGRGLTMALFGPLLYLKYKIDWTDYSDPYVANGVSHDLGTKSLEEITLRYGSSISSLRRAGIVKPNEARRLKKLVKEYKPLIKKQNFFSAVWSPKNTPAKGFSFKNLVASDPDNIKEEDDLASNDEVPELKMHLPQEKKMTKLQRKWEKLQYDYASRRAFPAYTDPSRLRRARMQVFGF